MLQEIDGDTVRFEMASAAAPTVVRDPADAEHALRADAHAGMNAHYRWPGRPAPPRHRCARCRSGGSSSGTSATTAMLALEPRPGPVVLHGENGAGKTNLLEAVSLLSPGPRPAPRPAGRARPRRRRPLASARRGRRPSGPGRDRDRRTTASAERRTVAADGQPLRSQNALGEHRQPALADARPWTACSPKAPRAGAASSTGWCWRSTRPTPPASPRFERALRERSHLLRAGRRDAGLAGGDRAAHRRGRRRGDRRPPRAGRATSTPSCAQAPLPFPRPRLALAGEVEALARHACRRVEAEQRLAEALAAEPRRRTPQTGGAAVGPHRSDLVADRRATRRARRALLDRPAEGLSDQHRAGRGAAAPAPPRRPADPAAGRGHGPSRPAPPRRAAGRAWSSSAPSPG